MPALKLLARLLLYYAALAGVVALTLWLFPALETYLPIGRVQALIVQAESLGIGQPDSIGGLHKAAAAAAHVASFGQSMVWLGAAVLGSLLAALPVSWVYMQIRNPDDYDQSLIDTIVVLPLVVTSIVVVVQHSLALAFSLAGIAGAARYRNTLKSSGDLLFILLAIGIGLAAGIGAVELAMVSSAAFNFAFVALWATSYGERSDMKRFLSEVEHHARKTQASDATTTITVEDSKTVITRTEAPDA